MANDQPRAYPGPHRPLRLSAQQRKEAYQRLLECKTKLSPEEVELLRAVFGDIFDTYYTIVWDRLRRRSLSIEDAEDLALETLDKLYLYLCEHGFETDLRRTTFAVTLSVLLNFLKVRGRSPLSLGLPTSSAERPVSLGGPERTAVAMAVLRRVLDQLTPEQVDVLDLVILSDLTHTAAARALRIPEGTVSSRARAVRLLFIEALRASRADSEKGRVSRGGSAQ